jgi:hypothetical protein
MAEGKGKKVRGGEGVKLRRSQLSLAQTGFVKAVLTHSIS